MRNLTRREALQKGGVFAGGIALGGTAISGNAAADHGKTGGTMLVKGEPQIGKTFTIEFDSRDEIQASCFASESALNTYQTVEIVYRNGGSQAGAVRANKNHMTEGTRYVALSS